MSSSDAVSLFHPFSQGELQQLEEGSGEHAEANGEITELLN